MTRAMMSVPPAANGTTSRTGLLGYAADCSAAEAMFDSPTASVAHATHVVIARRANARRGDPVAHENRVPRGCFVTLFLAMTAPLPAIRPLRRAARAPRREGSLRTPERFQPRRAAWGRGPP